MNILVITPIHPMQIIQNGQDLYNALGEDIDIFSIQAMALLYESLGQNYIVSNYLFTDAIRKNTKLLKREHNDLVVFGNIDKRTPIKFDYIVGLSPLPEVGDYSYDEEAALTMEEVLKTKPELNRRIYQYHNIEDVEYVFPTVRHLHLFLQKCGLKGDDNATTK